MIKKPAISVIMPAYNAEIFVERAIESILHQTFQDFELIIINDASNDRTLSLIKKYAKKDKRIRIINNKFNLQIAASLNKSISKARSNIIARMDADDISGLERLGIQYEYLKKNPDVVIIGTDIAIIDVQGNSISKREYPSSSKDLKRLMFRYSPFAHPVVMFRKDVFEECGGYDIKMVPCEDIDLWFKIGCKYKFGSISKPLLQYTLINTSNSHKKLKGLELLGFKIKFNAILKYGYRPSLYDIIYNLGEFTSIWFMPSKLRIWLYNFLRSRKLI